MLNFDYFKQIPLAELTPLHELCEKCETHSYSDPDTSAISARKALEWLVKAIYKMKKVTPGERESLMDLTTSPTFTDFIADPDLMKAVHWIRKVGNLAAHDGKVTRRDAFFSVLNLYNLVGAVLIKLRVLSTLAPFDKSLLPERPPRPRILIKAKPVDKSAEEFAETVEPEIVEEAPEVEPAVSWGDISEAETRCRFIDLMLREAGWDVLETEGDIAPPRPALRSRSRGCRTMPAKATPTMCSSVPMASLWL